MAKTQFLFESIFKVDFNTDESQLTIGEPEYYDSDNEEHGNRRDVYCDTNAFFNFLKDPQVCSCRRKCNQLVSAHENLFRNICAQNFQWNNKIRKELTYNALTNATDVSSPLMKNRRNQVNYSIPLVGRVCQKFFFSFFGCGERRVSNMMKSISQSYSLVLQPHGNTGNMNAELSDDIYRTVETFLQYFAKEHGESIATRKFVRKSKDGIKSLVSVENENYILLPSHWTFNDIFQIFLKKFPDLNEKLSFQTFRNIWRKNESLRFLKIRSAEKDVCDECCIFKNKIMDMSDDFFTAASDELLDSQNNHYSRYRLMRKKYEEDIKTSRNNEDSERPIVLAFDYAQNMEVPHKAQQPQSFYFSSLKKVHYFGMVDEELDKHTHFIYYESIGGEGADETASMIRYYLEKLQKRKSRTLIFWADNCGGQNKNSTIIQTLMDLVRDMDFDVVELKFQIKGHTRNSVDRGFGYTKRKYNQNDVHSLECIQKIINESAKNQLNDEKCTAVKLDETSKIFKKYTAYFMGKYRKSKDVQKYQIFRCTKDDLNSVYCWSASNPDVWDQHKLTLDRLNNTELENIDPDVERFAQRYGSLLAA